MYIDQTQAANPYLNLYLKKSVRCNFFKKRMGEGLITYFY